MSAWWLLLIVPVAMLLGAWVFIRLLNWATERMVGRWFGW